MNRAREKKKKKHERRQNSPSPEREGDDDAVAQATGGIWDTRDGSQGVAPLRVPVRRRRVTQKRGSRTEKTLCPVDFQNPLPSLRDRKEDSGLLAPSRRLPPFCER